MNSKRTHSISHILSFGRTSKGARLLLMLMTTLFLASCSESDNTTNEWENWKQKNDTYWATLYTQAKQRIASGDSSWKIFPKWSMSNQSPTNAGTALTNDSTDCIIVHVEAEGEGTQTPNYTDTVQIHYLGRLIPSPTYTATSSMPVMTTPKATTSRLCGHTLQSAETSFQASPQPS